MDKFCVSVDINIQNIKIEFSFCEARQAKAGHEPGSARKISSRSEPWARLVVRSQKLGSTRNE